MTPDALLASGRALLDPVFNFVGMTFDQAMSSKGSGGPYAVGLYSGQGWTVTMHVRDALGIIEYEHDGQVVPYERVASHLGLSEQIGYPGFPTGDPLVSFRRYREDLDQFPELRPTTELVPAFTETAVSYRQEKSASSRRATFEASGEGKALRDARVAWQQRDLQRAADLYALVPWEWLTDLDRRRFAFASDRGPRFDA